MESKLWTEEDDDTPAQRNRSAKDDDAVRGSYDIRSLLGKDINSLVNTGFSPRLVPEGTAIRLLRTRI